MADIRAKNPEGNWRDLSASNADILQVTGRRREVRVEKSIEANGSAHAAGDIMSETDTNGAGTAWVFNNVVSKDGGSGNIIMAKANTEVESQTERIALQVYTRTPTCELDDNAAAASPNPADSPYFVDEIELPALRSRGDNSFSAATPSTVGNIPIPFICEGDSKALHIVVIAVDATTHTATEKLAITIITEE